VEAMAFGNCVVVNATPQNLEVIGDAGFHYDGVQGAANLRGVLRQLLNQPQLVSAYRQMARGRAGECYSWEAVTTQYEELFWTLLQSKTSRM
jgi:glycosyltransferase involved in cell wall biosynthesis